MTELHEPERGWPRMHKDATRVYLGHAHMEYPTQPVHIWAEVSLVDDLNDHDRDKETTDHRTIRYGDVPSVSITWTYGTAAEVARGDGSGGAGIDADVLDAIEDDANRARARRLVEIADRWHNNTLTAGCVHQGRWWTCTRGRKTDELGVISEGCGTVNGWPVVGRLPYPQRGDQCSECGRNRWEEPTDRCPETGYRYGTSWLLDIPPAEVLAELRELSGGVLVGS